MFVRLIKPAVSAIDQTADYLNSKEAMIND